MRIPVYFCFFAVLVACAVEDPDPPDPEPTPEPTPAPPLLADPFGLINLTLVDGHGYVDLSGAFGTFTTSDLETWSVGGYLGGFGTFGPYWRYDLGGYPIPAEGESRFDDLGGWFPYAPQDEQWWDGGPRVGLGAFQTLRIDIDADGDPATPDVRAYQVDDPLLPGAAAWVAGSTPELNIEGGTDVVAFTATLTSTMPEPPALSEPGEGVVDVPRGQDFVVRWSASDHPVAVTLLQGLGPAWTFLAPAGTTEVSIPGDTMLASFRPGTATLIVAAQVEEVVPHPQGSVVVRVRAEARRDVVLLPDAGITPSTLQRGESAEATLSWWTGTLDGTTVVDLGPGVEIGPITPLVGEEHRATATITVAEEAPGGPRDLVLTHGATTLTTVGAFAVIDRAAPERCEDAAAAAPLDFGPVHATTAGLVDDLGSDLPCLDWSLTGPDAVFALDAFAGEPLTLRLSAPTFDGALYILGDCGDATTALHCADDGLSGQDESLTFDPAATGRYWVVVDAYSFGEVEPGGPFTLEVGGGVPMAPGWIQPGETRIQEVWRRGGWPVGAESALVDLGADITGTPSAVVDDLLEVDVVAAPGAAVGPRDLTVGLPGGAHTEAAALYVTELPSWDRCEDAASAPAVPLGQWRGYAVRATSDVDATACLDYATAGADVFIPIEVPADALFSIELRPDAGSDGQIYVLPDCASVEDCIIGADLGVSGEAETLSGSDWPVGRVILVIDRFGAEVGAATFGYELDLMMALP